MFKSPEHYKKDLIIRFVFVCIDYLYTFTPIVSSEEVSKVSH
jgi:hypothetical protein